MAWVVTAVALASLCPSMLQDPELGIARELASARRAQLSDVRYDLRFELGPGEEFVRGELKLRFELGEDSERLGDVVLDFDGEITAAELNGVLLETPPRRVHDHWILPVDRLAPEGNTFACEFTSRVAATGTPLTRYTDTTDGQEYLYTLVVPADAHRLFPCFDQPDLKGRFELRLTVPSDWTAVANGDVVDDPDFPRQREDGRLDFVFAETRPISTYLFAFAAGPFAIVDSSFPADVGDTPSRPLRMYYRRSKQERLETQRLFAMHRDALSWLVDYFGIDYPFGKLDLVLVPGFPYGGMEHAGAIFYRESALVFDAAPTESEQIRRSTLIYHELSHQWFGNLVTMEWFDDLWLKEGFATFVGYSLLDALEPGKNAWLRFHQRVKPRAYAIDSTRGTTPVYQKLQNLADAKSAYGAIVYNKAPAVLRELQVRLGVNRFRAGVQRFLERHAYANARWQDLVTALEEASDVDQTLWSDRWILAPGMPRVAVDWTTDASGDTIESFAIVQESVQPDGGVWPLSVEVLLLAADGTSRTERVITAAERHEVAELAGTSAPVAVIVNPRDVAYGLFVVDAASRDWLVANLPTVDDLLLRAVALSALWNTLREGELDPGRWCDLATRMLESEADAETHSWLLGTLGVALGRYLTEDAATPRREAATSTLIEQLTVGNHPELALQTVRFLAHRGDRSSVLPMLRNLLTGELRVPGLELGTRDRFLFASACLAAGDPAPLDAEIRKASASGEDVQREVYLARAAAPSDADKNRSFESYLDPNEPPEQWVQTSLGRFHWPGQGETTFPYLRRALDRVEWVKANRKIFFMPAWLDGFINAHTSDAAVDVVEAFLGERKDLTVDIEQKILQSLDELKRAVAIRNAWRAR